jgi:hypothetical protein
MNHVRLIFFDKGAITEWGIHRITPFSELKSTTPWGRNEICIIGVRQIDGTRFGGLLQQFLVRYTGYQRRYNAIA